MSTILVTGGAGFVGSHLVDRLLQDGHRVRVLSRRPGTAGSRVEVHVAAPDGRGLAAALQGVEQVYHLASATTPAASNADPAADVRDNLVGTLALLRAAAAAGVARLVYLSSGGTVYGHADALPIAETARTDPLCSYGIVKLAVEKYLALFRQLHGLEYTVLRLANPYGERQKPGAPGVVAAFMQRIARGEALEIWGDGSVVRDFVYVGDVVDALLAAARHRGEARCFNVGSGVGHSLNQLIEALRRTTGRPVRCRYAPARALDVPANVLDVARASAELGWAPRTPLEAGLERTWRWWCEQPR